jgi:SAM-dependent methyltransferase
LIESFLLTETLSLLAQREIRVLEIGCGSGTLTRLLAEAGYRGEYVGVDIADRFDRTEQAEFCRQFFRTDAHSFDPEGQFDLIISVSALEHIPDDRLLIRRLTTFVAPGGLQLHFVPSACGLFAYLWHGYRQYNLAAIADRFDVTRATVYTMGGMATLFLHVVFITLGEILMSFSLRKRIPRAYGWLLDYCLRLDRLFPKCSTMYAVIQPEPRNL